MARSSTYFTLGPLFLLSITSCGLLTYEQEPYTLANVCRRLPTDLCAARSSGCKTGGIGFDQDVCEARELASCESNVEAVRRGELSFTPWEISACLASLLPASDRGETDLHAALVAKGPCARIFEGTRAPRDACDRDAQCQQPRPHDQLAHCNRTQHCEVVRVLQNGETCELDNEGNHACDEGLVCELPTTGSNAAVGTCVRQLELGDSCSPLADAESCGRTGTCDRSALTCVPRRTMGSRCFSGRDCLSGHCTDEVCGPDTTLFHGGECGQPCIGSLCE